MFPFLFNWKMLRRSLSALTGGTINMFVLNDFSSRRRVVKSIEIPSSLLIGDLMILFECLT